MMRLKNYLKAGFETMIPCLIGICFIVFFGLIAFYMDTTIDSSSNGFVFVALIFSGVIVFLILSIIGFVIGFVEEYFKTKNNIKMEKLK